MVAVVRGDGGGAVVQRDDEVGAEPRAVRASEHAVGGALA
jgi:hypothetical protein